MATDTVAKGSTVRATLEYLLITHGDELREQVLAAVPAAMRSRLVSIDPTTELPYSDVLALWRASDEALRERDPQWMERSGAFSIESAGIQLYSGILRKRSPNEFLSQSVSLFQLFYSPGDMQVVEDEGAHAVLRLSGFDSEDVLFCRRQTGGLRRALSLAGGDAPQVKHVRCVHEDDAFCEWEMSWSLDAASDRMDGRSIAAPSV